MRKPERYLCERCGGSGKSNAAPFKGVPNHADGRCGLCDGDGYLGVIGTAICVHCGVTGPQVAPDSEFFMCRPCAEKRKRISKATNGFRSGCPQ